VRATFRIGAVMAMGAMFVLLLICRLAPGWLVGIFNKDPGVLAVGGEYLRIVAWNFVPSGLVFVSSSMFQALGNTIPSLVSSMIRTALLVIPAYLMSRMNGFELHWIWYLSVGVVAIHATMNLLLLQREYRRKLTFAVPATASAPAPVASMAAE
jgi:Na+-driven multidrug efflux pump